jgi:hypothetical protein
MVSSYRRTNPPQPDPQRLADRRADTPRSARIAPPSRSPRRRRHGSKVPLSQRHGRALARTAAFRMRLLRGPGWSVVVGMQEEHPYRARGGSSGVCGSARVARQTALPDRLPHFANKFFGHDVTDLAIRPDPGVRISTQVDAPCRTRLPPEVAGCDRQAFMDREPQHRPRTRQPAASPGRGEHDDRQSGKHRCHGSAATERGGEPVKTVRHPSEQPRLPRTTAPIAEGPKRRRPELTRRPVWAGRARFSTFPDGSALLRTAAYPTSTGDDRIRRAMADRRQTAHLTAADERGLVAA